MPSNSTVSAQISQPSTTLITPLGGNELGTAGMQRMRTSEVKGVSRFNFCE